MANEKAGIDYVEVMGDLNRAAWKLQGIAGLMLCRNADESLDLSGDETNGIYFILSQIVDEIKENAKLIERAHHEN